MQTAYGELVQQAVAAGTGDFRGADPAIAVEREPEQGFAGEMHAGWARGGDALPQQRRVGGEGVVLVPI